MRPHRCQALPVVVGLLRATGSPDDSEPSVCRRLGSFHRTSRDNLGRLRVDDMVSILPGG